MKIQIRKNWRDYLLYFLFTKVQKVEGITSDIINSNKHIILWDFDKLPYDELEKTLKAVKKKYLLGDIFIMSDKEESYRAMCFNEVELKDYYKILLDTIGLDYSFFRWAVKRNHGTIRISDKNGRRENEIIAVITDNKVARIPKNMLSKLNYVWYEADIDSKVINIGKTDIDKEVKN